jgi:hypothetical protein
MHGHRDCCTAAGGIVLNLDSCVSELCISVFKGTYIGDSHGKMLESSSVRVRRTWIQTMV